MEAANLLDLAARRSRETRPEVEEYATTIDELRRDFEMDVAPLAPVERS